MNLKNLPYTFFLFIACWLFLATSAKGADNSKFLHIGTEYWKFYEGKTREQVNSDATLQPIIVEVPGSWSTEGNNEMGYGTYVAKVPVATYKGKMAAIRFKSVGTSYRLYINGLFMTEVGKFGTSAEEAKPDFKPQTFSFLQETDTLLIEVEVSNYSYRQAGLWFTPLLGNHSEIDSYVNEEIIVSAFISGALVLLFVYFLIFYYIRPKDKSSLYFALICLFSALRIGVTGEILLRQMPINISWELLVRIEFASLAAVVLLGLFYLHSLFYRDANKFVINSLKGILGLLVAFYLIVPVKFTSYSIPYFLIVCVVVLLYLLNLVIKVVIHKRSFAKWVAAAFTVIFFAGINDILFSQGVIESVYLLPLGILVFSAIQAIILTRLFTDSVKEVELLSKKLSDINKNQKNIIDERTHLLNMQAKELQQSNQIKDKVFSIIAHDLRAPIKSLSTVLGWVADDDLTFEEVKKSLASISKNVDTLNLTLENLLHWSRSQLNGIHGEPELIDIRKPVQEMQELYKFQAGEKRVQIVNGITERAIINFDKHQLNLLLRNLISNAIKFTHPGGKITINSQVDNGGNTVMCIEDNGVGMSKEAVNKIFNAGEHFTTFGTQNEKGTGLGLLLCKEYLEQGSGKIWIESEEGQGTKVFLQFPGQA